ncbi:NAD(P)H-hydrate dehydratase, partial [Alphaproteobacteria bacterium]|nr:NAD(P)H-hydrate dehydratase [Alphaproteobacteria bacterium]
GEMSGAARIVALSARKIGAGLSTIKIEKNQLLNYAGTEPGTIVNFSEKIQINDYDLVVLGPGLGKKYSLSKILKILRDFKKTIILDADALSIFEKKKEHLFSILKKRTKTILTPHEGEFKRLFGEIKNDKLSAALLASKKTNSTIIFKGNDTVVAFPNEDVFINDGANSSLATAGTGDMLCGMIGGLICQGMEIKHSILYAIFIQNKLSNNTNNTIVEDFINDIPFHCDWLK